MSIENEFQNTNWDGLERRTNIPATNAVTLIELIKYFDARFNAHLGKYESLMKEHTIEEMERFQRIEAAVNAASAASEARYVMLSQQILASNQRADQVEAAFARDEHGKPDFSGHRGDHTSRKKLGEWVAGTKRGVLAKVLEWAAVVIVATVIFKLAPHLLAPVFAPGM
jgi:hypothetical protein